MPACDMVKLVNTPIAYSGISRATLGAGRDEQDHGGDGQRDDAVGEHQPVPALGELLGHEVVAGVEAGQPGEVGEAGVGGEDEDQHGAGLEDGEEHAAHGAGPEHRLADLGDHGRRPAHVRHRVHLHREGRKPEEHEAEGGAHDDERRAGVLPLRPAERRHAVGDGLHAGHGRARRRRTRGGRCTAWRHRRSPGRRCSKCPCGRRRRPRP